MKPFADQAKDPSIIDTLFNHIHQQLLVNVIEKSTYISINYPVDVLFPALLT